MRGDQLEAGVVVVAEACQGGEVRCLTVWQVRHILHLLAHYVMFVVCEISVIFCRLESLLLFPM